MLAPGAEFPAESGWGEMAMLSHAGYGEFVRELCVESGLGIDYRVCGALDIVMEGEEVLGKGEALTAAEAAVLAPGLRGSGIAGAVHCAKDAVVDPVDVMRSLRRVCTARGVRVMEQCRVLSIRGRGAVVHVATEANGVLEADAAVVASGAWSSQIAVHGEEEALPVPEAFPVRGHLVGYRHEPGSLGPIVRHGHTYLLQRGSGRTIAGTSQEEVGFERKVDAATVEDIHKRAAALLPGLIGGRPEESWMGFRPATRSYTPELRRLEGTRVWLAYGHFRNGILLAPVTAARLSGEILAS